MTWGNPWRVAAWRDLTAKGAGNYSILIADSFIPFGQGAIMKRWPYIISI